MFNENIKSMEWFRDNGTRPIKTVTMEAIKEESLLTVKWFIENNCNKDKDCLYYASLYYNKDIFNLLLLSGSHCDERPRLLAINNNDREMLTLIAKYHPLFVECTYMAVEYNDIELLHWLRVNNFPWAQIHASLPRLKIAMIHFNGL